MTGVRKQADDGDYQFGNGAADFLVDSSAEVAQRINTRLLLMQGEWFLDKFDGTPWGTAILGAHTKPLYDLAIQERVLRTEGVVEILNYDSSVDPVTRKLSVTMQVRTAFGETPVTGIF